MRRRTPQVLLAILLLFFPVGRVFAEQFAYMPPECSSADAAGRDPDALLRCYAPVFWIDPGERSFNRIGSPAIRLDGARERVWIDTETPAVFVSARTDRIGLTDVLHLVYRIHFPRLAFKPAVFFEMHRNAGLLTIVTLRAGDLAPILVTTVYSCGCYRALLPTDLFPPDALPQKWPKDRKRVFGKSLPAVVTHPQSGGRRLVVLLASRTHRVEEIQTLEQPRSGRSVALPLRPMEDLHRLPVAGREGAPASFFYTEGALKGHVRGAWSPIEGLTAGVLVLDPTLGMDKDFGDPRETGTRFYTSLLPWQRDASRLDRFDPLLRTLRFHLEALERPSR